MDTRTARIIELPESSVYEQQFSVRYDYPVYFTEAVFRRDNPVFEHALCRHEPAKRHRFVVVVDANVAASWPTLAHDIAAYARERADRMDLVAPPEVIPGGEQVKNDPSVLARIQQFPDVLKSGHGQSCTKLGSQIAGEFFFHDIQQQSRDCLAGFDEYIACKTVVDNYIYFTTEELFGFCISNEVQVTFFEEREGLLDQAVSFPFLLAIGK